MKKNSLITVVLLTLFCLCIAFYHYFKKKVDTSKTPSTALIGERASHTDVRKINQAPAEQPNEKSPTDSLNQKPVLPAPKDPRKKALGAAQMRKLLDSQYGPLFSRLALSDDDIESLKTLIVNDSFELDDAFAKFHPQPRMGTPEYDAIINRQLDIFINKASSILAPDGCEMLRHYSETLGQRGVVSGINISLQGTAEALNDAQKEQLISVLAKHCTVGREIFPVIHNEAVEEAAGFLSNAQLDAVKQFQEYLLLRHNAVREKLKK